MSLILITARKDFPYTGRPNLHLFEPTLESLKHQTTKDFELIIVDVMYEKRKDYFKNLDLPFVVKHIPSHPNIWLENGFPGVCRQHNKGIIFADGELLFFFGDGNMVAPEFIEKLYGRYQEGYFPLSWYQYDLGYDKTAVLGGGKNCVSPVSYDICGYRGEKVFIEDRYNRVFEGNNRESAAAPWEWWFGCSSANLDALLKVGGWDQKMDGDKMLMDTDLGSRIEMAGYRSRFALFRDIFLMRCKMDGGGYCFDAAKDSRGFEVTLKCNYGILWHSRYFNRFRANCQRLEDSDIEWIKNIFCVKFCPNGKNCRENHPWQYKFRHKPNFVGHGSSKKWWEFWREHQGLVDLTEERKMRISGEKYTEGTFTD